MTGSLSRRRRRRARGRARAALSGAAIVVTCGACGGSGSNHGPLTHAAFVQRAQAACTEWNRKAEALPANLAKPTDMPSLGRYITAMAPLARDELAALKVIVPPKAQAAQWNQVLSGLEAQLADADKIAAAVKANNLTAANQAIAALTSHHVNQFAAQLGLPACADNAQPNGAA